MNVEVRGLREAIARFQAMRENLADPTPALTQAGQVVRYAAVRRIRQGGGDQSWAPDAPLTVAAKGSLHVGIDTGRMWQSIGISQSSSRSVTVGTNVGYARYFQFGRGPVRASGRALAIGRGKRMFFLRSVGPQPARPFLLIGDAERNKIRAIFLRHAKALPPAA